MVILMALITVSGGARAETPQVNPILACGGATNGESYLIVPRWPAYDFMGGAPTVNITYPLDGGTYYQNNIQLNATVTGNTTTPTCQYRINSGAWNAYNCVNATVTFPEGSVTVEVQATDAGGTGTDSVTFDVQTTSSIAGGNHLPLLLFPLMITTGLLIYGAKQNERPRRHKPTTQRRRRRW